MSRAGKPTFNSVNEALNGWIKEELYIDFKFAECRSRDDAKSILEDYIKYYNEQHPAMPWDTILPPITSKNKFFVSTFLDWYI